MRCPCPLHTVVLLMLALAPAAAWAHPIPDVPVRASFEAGGVMTLQVEVDPRCFEEDPNAALSILKKDLGYWKKELLDSVKAKAQPFVEATLAFHLPPLGQIKPVFQWEYTAHDNVPLNHPDDIVVLTGTWTTPVPAGATGYQLKALTAGELNVVVLNRVLGQELKRIQVLFPDEESKVLDITSSLSAAASEPASAPVP